MISKLLTWAAADRTRRLAPLIVLCLGTLIINIDTTIVNIALPRIRADLGFAEDSLMWVVDAYLATFAGLLLIGGRMGDRLGHRRIFLLGVAIFTLTSLGCGLAESQQMLVLMRGFQGIGGALVSVQALSLAANLFNEPAGRAKAMGAYAFVGVSGGSIGLCLGGALLTSTGWRWIFFINVPVGIAIVLLSRVLLPVSLAVRTSPAETPLIPLHLLRVPNLWIANIVSSLLSAGMFGWLFVYSRYMQVLLKYEPMQVMLAYLPVNLMVAVISLGVSPALAIRFGLRRPLVTGLLLAAGGLALLARTPAHASPLTDLLPAMLLIGLGAGIANAPMMLGALEKVDPRDSGAASGIIRTTSLLGSGLGLALMSAIAAGRTRHLVTSGLDPQLALQGGYQTALIVGAGLVAMAALVATSLSSQPTRMVG